MSSTGFKWSDVNPEGPAADPRLDFLRLDKNFCSSDSNGTSGMCSQQALHLHIWFVVGASWCPATFQSAIIPKCHFRAFQGLASGRQFSHLNQRLLGLHVAQHHLQVCDGVSSGVGQPWRVHHKHMMPLTILPTNHH